MGNAVKSYTVGRHWWLVTWVCQSLELLKAFDELDWRISDERRD